MCRCAMPGAAVAPRSPPNTAVHSIRAVTSGLEPVVLIPSWEQPGAGNLSDKLGASWEPVIGLHSSMVGPSQRETLLKESHAAYS